MESSLKWSSPQSTSGSFLIAVAVHAVTLGIVLGIANFGFRTHEEKPSINDEVLYETFTAPPEPTKVPRQIASAPEPETPTEKQTDTTAKEMQDEKSTISGTQAAAKVQSGTGAQGVGDAATTPYYRIKPKYPRAALISGVEGWILLKIDINETGSVENVRVVGGEPRSMFQDEARRAVEKWKYKPFLGASGQPVRKTDHEVRVDFKLKDAA